MLVLSRKPGEAVQIGGGISIVVLDVRGSRARIGVDAPADVAIIREEPAQSQAGVRLPMSALAQRKAS